MSDNLDNIKTNLLNNSSVKNIKEEQEQTIKKNHELMLLNT